MATKETKENIIDISAFFSKDNEEKGVWYEPTVDGRKVGFELRIYGANSNKADVLNDVWAKTKTELASITDVAVRLKKTDEAFATRVAGYVSDIRGKNGAKLTISGKEIDKADIEQIMANSPALEEEVLRFAARNENFLEIKKND